MANGGGFVTLGDLLEEQGDSQRDEEILGRLKVLAQESLPEGWTKWEIKKSSKEEIFGESVEVATLNKLVFAIPTMGLVKAFDPEADHLSEKAYRDIRLKLLDWAFTRALIVGPPAIANRIRGSAARTELFKEAIAPLKEVMIPRREVDQILSGALEEGTRKRRSTSMTSDRSGPVKRSKVDMLEEKMERMFAFMAEKIESLCEIRQPPTQSDESEEDSENESEPYSQREPSPDSEWHAPALDTSGVTDMASLDDLDFRPEVKEADPVIPEPSPELKEEGIGCQRLGTTGWSRIRYKEVEKKLHASPVFSALKINTELSSVARDFSWLGKQDSLLGTICHGLLLQRRAIAEDLRALAREYPASGGEVKRILKESNFKSLSDDLLQFVCAHRAETIENRRKIFKAKNETLTTALHQIPPSATHLFEEKILSTFIKDNGGTGQVFTSKQGKFPVKKTSNFRKPSATGFYQSKTSAGHGRQRNSFQPSPRPSTSRTSASKSQRDSPRKKSGKQRPSNKKY
ncbi:uncharacterized protein LOC132904244 [Amyelois transitella]|uniref:uncharacterized protein LOC132904244 n=1 Tax=Amyelois transitella TaxID=680683 RepID=UPI0029900ACC|nr:uncharacterized protein LOC132904244 [Amyelois transitella]